MAVLDFKSLLTRNPIIINRVELHGAALTIERNKERRINLREISKNTSRPSVAKPSPADSQKPTEHRAAAPKNTDPSIQFRRIELNGTVRYNDRARSEDALF